MFKSINNLLPHDFIKITQLNSDYHNYNTRISSLPRSEFARTNYRKFTIKCIGPYVWNKLPTEFRSLNFSPFKNKVRFWLLTHNIYIMTAYEHNASNKHCLKKLIIPLLVPNLQFSFYKIYVFKIQLITSILV